MRVSLRFVSKSTGTDMSGRGVVAIQPPGSLRMVLLGPAGLTAMDLLIRDDTWRMSLPAWNKSFHNGQTSEQETRSLPVAFLRWWLLTPLDGRLLAGWQTTVQSEWVLRSGDAVVDIIAAHGRLDVTRRGAVVERVLSDERRCGHTRYENEDVGLTVDVQCEEWTPGPPNPRAFDLE